jgi:signal transduction histidine kinase/ActR/RegA family two-component response regulator
LPLTACLEQGSLFEEAHLQAQLRLLNRVAQAAAGNLDLAHILEVALRELGRHLPMTLSAVWLADQDRPSHPAVDAPGEGAVVLRLADLSTDHGALADRAGLMAGMSVPLAGTPFAPCWDGGGAVTMDWTGLAVPEPSPGERPSALGLYVPAPGPLACFATPLRSGDQTVGVLQCLTARPGGFTSESVQVLYLVADLLGPAISNCQLHSRLCTTSEELRATQEQLIRNEKIRAIGELASGMAHDFNNSLCGVLGFLEMALMDRGLSTASRGHLELARTCALDAAQTVRRVQDFARTRRKNSVFEWLDLNQVVQEAIELTRPKWENLERSRGVPIVLELYLEATLPVLGNAPELREVLTNLVFNAVDAMPQGGTLAVRTWDDRASAFLAVEDTGVGMSSAVRQRLFEPFFTTKGERGNGLGLSVTFGIVRQHGGDITVTSEAGQGSVFTIRLPGAADDKPAVPEAPTCHVTAVSPAPQAPALGGSPAISSGLRILVVEDEDAVGRFLATVLTSLGHRPWVAQTATAALQALGAEPFDLVITDMGLPDLSGEEVARTVAEQAPQTPVVLLTGWADQLRADPRSLPGVTRILAKPVTIERLAETLQAVCPGGSDKVTR